MSLMARRGAHQDSEYSLRFEEGENCPRPGISCPCGLERQPEAAPHLGLSVRPGVRGLKEYTFRDGAGTGLHA